MRELSVSNNALTGTLPPELITLTMLEYIGFYSNPGLCAPIDSAFQQWLQSIDLALGSSCTTADLDSPADRAVLVAFYDAMGGANWTDNENWLSPTTPMRDWHGVATDANGRSHRAGASGKQPSRTDTSGVG